MALFRRILSPREQPQILGDQDGSEDHSVVERRSRNNQRGQSDNHRQHRRTNSDGEGRILQASEPSGISLLHAPPQLPPRNLEPCSQQHFATGLGYRRTQSGGSTVMIRHQTPPDCIDANTATYFNPADTLNALNGKVTGNHHAERTATQTLQQARNQQMFEKIMAHNDPVLRGNMHSHPTDVVVDRSEYSVPFQTEEHGTQSVTKQPRKHRHSTNATRSEPHGRRLSHPPNFAPPPPPPSSGEERLSSVSPISPSSQNADYDSPWDSNKFHLHRIRQGSGRQRSDSTPSAQGVPPTTPPCGVTAPSCSDERHGSSTPPDRLHPPVHKTSELEQPKRSPPQHPPTNQTWPKNNSDLAEVSCAKPVTSSPLPPLPPRNPQPDHASSLPGELDRVGPRNGGFSSVGDEPMHDYVIPPDARFSSVEDDLVHDYVIPPDATSSSSQDSMHEASPIINKKGHRYPPLLPGSNIRPNYMYPPDPRLLPPPAYLINTLLPLENQPWYHGSITRDTAEAVLRDQADFSFLVRKSETQRTDYSLSIRDKTSSLANGFVHLRISRSPDGNGYVLGQFSSTFPNVSECIAFYTHHQLTIKDIKHRRLGFPVSRW